MRKNKKTIEFKFERTLQTTPTKAYDAWLNPKVKGTPWSESDKLLLTAKVDGFFYWLTNGTPHYGRFTKTERGKCLRHTWMSPYTLGEESTVTVTFKKSGDSTIMTLVHSDLPDDEMAKPHEQGWNHFMDLFPKQFGRK